MEDGAVGDNARMVDEGDKELVRVAAEDLVFLRERWDQTIKDEDLRRGSTTMRQLLVDGLFSRAWRAADFEKQPVIPAPDLRDAVAGLQPLFIRFASAGGAKYGGIEIQQMLHYDQAMSDAVIKQRYERQKDGPRLTEFPLSSFLESTCLVVRGTFVKRRELIQFIANVKGGAHLGSKTDGPRKHPPVFTSLQNVDRYQIVEKDALYFELLSIGQTVASAPDVETFLERYESML